MTGFEIKSVRLRLANVPATTSSLQQNSGKLLANIHSRIPGLQTPVTNSQQANTSWKDWLGKKALTSIEGAGYGLVEWSLSASGAAYYNFRNPYWVFPQSRVFFEKKFPKLVNIPEQFSKHAFHKKNFPSRAKFLAPYKNGAAILGLINFASAYLSYTQALRQDGVSQGKKTAFGKEWAKFIGRIGGGLVGGGIGCLTASFVGGFLGSPLALGASAIGGGIGANIGESLTERAYDRNPRIFAGLNNYSHELGITS